MKENNTEPDWFSLIMLFIFTGFIGAFFFAGLGYLITKLIKYIFPKTNKIKLDNVGFTNYGYRGLSFTILIFLLIIFVVLLLDPNTTTFTKYPDFQ